jgi:hypothetical protein
VRESFWFGLSAVASWLPYSALLILTYLGQAQGQLEARSSVDEDSLRGFVRSYFERLSVPEDKTAGYFDAFVDLNGDGKPEAIVYITGQSWCGSGGCTLLILTPEGSSYKVVTKIPITRLPVRVLTKASNGWRNLGVWVQGGGIQPGYEAELRFDGKTYPRNPSTNAARRLVGRVTGEVVIASSPNRAGKSLY